MQVINKKLTFSEENNKLKSFELVVTQFQISLSTECNITVA